MTLTAAQFRQIVDLCAPHMQTTAARQTCFYGAFSNAPFHNQINWEGTTTDYVAHLLRTLLTLHRYNGEHPLRTLLVSLKSEYGEDIQAQIDALLPHIDALPEGSTLPALPLTLFLSYARADDEPFVRRLYDDLKAHGFNVWFDRVSMPSRGLGFAPEIARAIERADHLLLVCGPAVYSSGYVQAEWQHALAHCKPILPVVRLGDFPPPILDQLSVNPVDALDMRDGATYAETFAHLLRQVRDQPLPLGALTNVRAPEQWYIMRSAPQRQVIQSLTALGRENTVAISAINGLGGVGKSVLAAMVAHDCEIRRTFPHGIALIEVGKQPNLTELQARLGKLVGLEAAEFKENLDANRQLLSAAFLGKRMLIILDNVWNKHAVDAANFGAEGVKFIVTTRLVNLANMLGRSVRVDLLLPEEGADLIVRRAELKDDQRAACEAVSRQLNGLTLAVSIAAAKIKNDALTPEAYLARLKNAENPLGELTLADPDDPYADANQPEQNFAASLNLTYGDLNAEMQRRFRLLGVFAPEGTFDVAAVAAVWDEPLETAQTKLNLLVNLELAARDEGERYSQHSLLRAYARALLREADALEDTAERHAAYYLAHMRAANDAQTYYTMRDDLPQLRVAFGWAEQTQQPDLALGILVNTANLLRMLNLGEEYLDWANRLVVLVQTHGGDLGAALGTRGNAYQSAATVVVGEDRRARLLQALNDYTTALDLRRDVPLAYAMTLGNMGNLYNTLEDYSKALDCMWKAYLGFVQAQHAPYIEQSQRILGQFKGQLGARFDALWQEVIGQPQPAWLQANDDTDRLQGLLIAWVQTPDWSASRTYLEAHQADILTEQAEQAMEMLVQGNNNHPELVRHLELLRSARREGIAAAYAQMGSGQDEGA